MVARSATSDGSLTKPVFLDGHATTPVAQAVLEAMWPFFTEEFGNPSAPSIPGQVAREAIEVARDRVRSLCAAPSSTVTFTSGATEALNLALQGLVAALFHGTPVRIAATPVEHKAALQTLSALAERNTVDLTLLKVDQRGRIDLGEIERLAGGGVRVFCVMRANNEIGNIYPVPDIAKMVHACGGIVVTDATQALGWIASDRPMYGADILVCSSHKIHGPKGLGAIVRNPGINLRPTIYGGGQEAGLRPGTENVPGIVGFGVACLLSSEFTRDDHAVDQVRRLRDEFESRLGERVGQLRVNGDQRARLPNNSNISIGGVPGDLLLARLRSEVAFSLGSACTASENGPSHVLSALRLPPARLDSAIRLGFTRESSANQVSHVLDLFCRAVPTVRRLLA